MPIFSVAASILDQVNGYALVYVGITGEAFWPSARRAVGLASRRRSGQLLDCENYDAGMADRRHSDQVTVDAELGGDGPVHCHRWLSLHGALASQSGLRTCRRHPLRRRPVPCDQDGVCGTHGRVGF